MLAPGVMSAPARVYVVRARGKELQSSESCMTHRVELEGVTRQQWFFEKLGSTSTSCDG